MALIYCNQCGKQVSDRAQCCPHCGAPVADKAVVDHSKIGATLQTRQASTSMPKVTRIENPPKKRGWLPFVILAIVLAAILAGLGGWYSRSEQIKQQQLEEQQARERARQDSIAEAQRIEQARLDSIAAAEQARRDSIEQLHQNIVNAYLTKLRNLRSTDSDNATHYFLHDINKDGIPELWIAGDFGCSCTRAFMYAGGALKQIYSGSGLGHSSYHLRDGTLLCHFTHMGSESLDKIVYSGGKVVEKNILKQEFFDSMDGEYNEVYDPKVRTYSSSDEGPIRAIFY